MPPLPLPSVTLVTIDTAEHALTALALRDTLAQIRPAAVHIWTNKAAPYEAFPTAKLFHLPPLDLSGICRTRWYDVAAYVATSHILFIEWDGWAVDGSMWTNAFLQYDYTGAPWPWHQDRRVGNGGFSLRSRRLLEILSTHQEKFPFNAEEDEAICRTYRPTLEGGFKVRFAPEDLAWRFSQEHLATAGQASHPCFGFHDPRNFHRFLPPEGLRERLAAAGPYAQEKLRGLGVMK